MKRRTIIIIFTISLLVGMGIVMQSRVTNGLMLYVAPSTVQDYKTMAEGEQQNLENIQGRIADANEKLQNYEDNLDNQENQDIIDNINDEYMKYGIFSGRLSVAGPGVILTVDDGNRELFLGEDINNVLVHDEDIFIIINELKRAGAEAISVNGQRILHDTSISCSGYTVRINGVTYARPFEIQAIGDARKMTSMLLGPEGYGTYLKEWGVIFKIKTADEIVIEGTADVDRYVYKYSKTI